MRRSELEAFVGTRRKLRIHRRIPSEPTHNGYVVGLGDALVLVHQFHDFYPEGYAALRLEDITSIRSGPYERVWERMLEAEGLIAGLRLANPPRLSSVRELLIDLSTRRETVIVECEDLEDAIEDFYIGRILDVGADTLHFANFDALGNWDAEAHAIALDEITIVQFATPYARTFARHLERPCPFVSS